MELSTFSYQMNLSSLSYGFANKDSFFDLKITLDENPKNESLSFYVNKYKDDTRLFCSVISFHEGKDEVILEDWEVQCAPEDFSCISLFEERSIKFLYFGIGDDVFEAALYQDRGYLKVSAINQNFEIKRFYLKNYFSS